ncbi:MAG: exo-alpha-sialidase [Planctomycetes bacterium]|nr:exo-alpha-sialidase [Planctomycetota bacterium]
MHLQPILSIAAVTSLALAASAQTTIGTQVHVDAPAATGPCNETTMAASAANPLEIVAGWNDYRSNIRCGGGISMDGGKTWSDVVLRPPVPNQASVEGDPMSCYDDRTGALWLGAISFAGNGGVYVARKDAGSPTFNPSVMAKASGGADKCWMAAGPAHNNPNATKVYIAYNEGLLRSSDMGNTWQGPVNLGSLLGPVPRVGPNGEVYVVTWDVGFSHFLKRSFDGGVTFGPAITVANRLDSWGVDATRVAGEARVTCINGFACDPVNGALYVVYPDTTNIKPNGSNLDIYFTKSTNQGTTWSTPTVINLDASPTPGDQYFPWIECDRNGRLHLTFYDTRTPVQNDSAATALITPYYSYSDDGGATWTEAKLMTSPWNSANDGFGGIFIGDYLGMATGGHLTTPLYMSTQNGIADTFTHRIQDGPAITYCYGINCPCGNDDPRRGCGNVGSDSNVATGSELAVGGTDSLASDDLTMTLSGIKPGSFALIFTSQTLANVTFGDGKRCVGGALKRYAIKAADINGDVVFGPGELVGYAASHWGAPLAGQDWNYQGWYRDNPSACGQNYNVTNAAIVNWKP